MTAHLKAMDAGTLRTITRGSTKLAGVTRTIKTVKVMDGGVLRTVAIFTGPLTAAASPPSATGAYGGSGALPPQTLTTDLVTAISSGGTAPLTYVWAYLSGDTFSVSHPTSAGTYFSHNFTSFGSRNGVYRCTVTDSLGLTATVDVPVDIEFSF
jgi:hypothetical protein